MHVLLLACLMAAGSQAGEPRRLAVLELNSQRLAPSDRTSYQAPYFTDLFRQKAVQLLPKLAVITRENLLTLLQASGKDLSQCEGTCAVDTARLIGADYVVAGDFARVGPAVKLTLTLYDAHSGNVLAGTTAAGRNPEGLDESAQLVADDLFTPLLAQYGGPQQPKAPPPRGGSPRAHVASIILLGAGAAMGVASGGFALAGKHVNDEIQGTPQATRADLDALASHGQSYNKAAIGFSIAAVVAIAIAIPLFFATGEP